MRDDQATNRVVCEFTTSMPDDVRLAGLQTEQVLDVESSVHARNYCDTA